MDINDGPIVRYVLSMSVVTDSAMYVDSTHTVHQLCCAVHHITTPHQTSETLCALVHARSLHTELLHTTHLRMLPFFTRHTSP